MARARTKDSAMMRRLFESTVVSAISFFIISLSGLVIVPIIVRKWGLAEFGILVIGRTLLPVGLVGIFDLGVSEMSTQVVARTRANNAWQPASNQLSVLLLTAVLISLASALVLVAFEPFFQRLFHIDSTHADAFQLILYVTAAANLFLFPGLIGEGVLRGFERFPFLRLIDVAAALAYALGTIIAVFLSLPFEEVALIYLGTLVLRGLVVCFEAWRLSTAAGFHASLRAEKLLLVNTLRHCWIIMQGKILGSLQWTLLPVIVGTLLGPGPVAVYDIVTRLPRFAKSVLALLCGSLLPFSVQLEQLNAQREMIRLARAGLILLPAITVPPLVGCALFAEPILRLWIGPQMVDYSWWMAMMFGVTIIHQYLSFASVIMLSRPEVLKVLNRIALLNVVIMGIVIAATFVNLGERAFILGQALAWLAIWPIQSFVIARQLRIGSRMLGRVAFVQGMLMGPAVLLAFWDPDLFRVSGIPQLVAAIGLWTVVQWFLHYWLILEESERKEIHRILGGLFSMWARILRPALTK
jgi:O-antigen/teichoic acid export membrane protein